MGPSREIGSDWPSQAFPGDRKPNLAGSSQATASKRVREGALPAENRPSPGRTRGSCVSAAGWPGLTHEVGTSGQALHGWDRGKKGFAKK